MGTIPVSVKQLVSRLGVNEDIASFVAALGANLGMPACAGIWPTLLAVLAINIFDIPYSIGQYVFLIVLTLIVSIGTVGVPGTSTVTTTALFTAAGLPVEIIVLLVPISSVVDMMRTATNVTGAATAAVLVAKSEQLLDREVYDQKKSLILITISAVFFHSVKISERQMKNIFFHTGKVDLMFDQILINSGIINTSL